jgi:IS5 family transposase
MLIDRYPAEDVFARVPEVAAQTDPVLKELDRLLDDDALYQSVRADLGKRYRYTLIHGRHSTPVEVLLRMLICKHLYAWSFKETEERVKDSLVLRWFSRVYFQRVPDSTTLFRWLQTIRPETLHARECPSRALSQASKSDHRAQIAPGWDLRANQHPSSH